MIECDTVLRARRLVTAAGEGSGCVGVVGGRIAAITPLEAGPDGRRVIELGDDVVLLPGLVDSHVRVNEPGRTECTPELKRLELGLPVVWTEARRRGFSLTDVVRWMAEGPARLLGLHHKNPLTPYDGHRLLGVVRGTWLRGEELTGERPRGHLLTRGGA